MQARMQHLTVTKGAATVVEGFAAPIYSSQPLHANSSNMKQQHRAALHAVLLTGMACELLLKGKSISNFNYACHS